MMVKDELKKVKEWHRRCAGEQKRKARCYRGGNMNHVFFVLER